MLYAYQLTVWLLCIGMFIVTLEHWYSLDEFTPSGVYAWPILRLLHVTRVGKFITLVVDQAPGVGAVRAILLIRLLCITSICFLGVGTVGFYAALVTLSLINVLFTFRRVFGDDGSDQMTTIVLLTLCLCCWPGCSTLVKSCGLWFLALQLCLSYCAAGVAKALSGQWRSGGAVYRVFNTGAFGAPWAARMLQDRNSVNLALCWSVILMEVFYPACIVLPAPWKWAFPIWGLSFHILCGIIMGLNSFIFTFLATYPALIYIASQVNM
jgi:hypothetical protein